MAAHQAPPSLGFSKQEEHWSGLPFPSPMHDSEKWKWSHWAMSDFVTPWTVAYQAPPFMGFSRQEYWSGLPLLSPEKHLLLLYWLCQSLWLCGYNKLWKILQEMGIPDHLTCLLKNLCVGQEATARAGHGTTDWLQIGKGVHQGCILSPCLFNLYVEHIMRNGWMKHKLESRLSGEISITSDLQMTPPL